MGGSKSKETPSPNHLPTVSSISVILIDIYGHRVNKECYPNWLFSALAKSLIVEYEIENVEAINISISGWTIKYDQNENKPLQDLGFKNKSEVTIMHKRKGTQLISLRIMDREGSQKTITVSSECNYKDLCEVFERKYKTSLWISTVCHKTKILASDTLYSTKLKDIGIKNNDELMVLPNQVGGYLWLN